MSLFAHGLGDGYDLALRDEATVEDMHRITVANLPRLRHWEDWAHRAPVLADTRDFTRSGVRAYAEGTAIPCVIRAGGVPIGSIALRIHRVTGVAEMGYWVDGAHEGRGVVRRAAVVLIDHAFSRLRLSRVEARASVGNTRSRALLEGLGFQKEGVLRRALPVGEDRHDMVVYGLLDSDPRE